MEKTLDLTRKRITKNREYTLSDVIDISPEETLELVNELNDMMIYWFEKCDKIKEELSWYKTRRKR